MITFKTKTAVHASQFRGHWKPECHWIVEPGEPNTASFVQELLDKYAPHVEAYSITSFGSSYCVELQFRDHAVGVKCNNEYRRGWRKGGRVATALKAAEKPASKRLRSHRMYILPDGTEFFYYARWDGHGNLMGKVLTEEGYVPDKDGCIRLDNRIVHRSILEKATMVPLGEERFTIGERPLPQATARQKQLVHDTVCRLRAKTSLYGPGDCYNGMEVDKVYRAIKLPKYKVISALNQLISEQLIECDGEYVWLTTIGWKAWSKWNDRFFLNIVFNESGQDWPDWEDRDYWKDIEPSVWEELEAEFVSLDDGDEDKARQGK